MYILIIILNSTSDTLIFLWWLVSYVRWNKSGQSGYLGPVLSTFVVVLVVIFGPYVSLSALYIYMDGIIWMVYL